MQVIQALVYQDIARSRASVSNTMTNPQQSHSALSPTSTANSLSQQLAQRTLLLSTLQSANGFDNAQLVQSDRSLTITYSRATGAFKRCLPRNRKLGGVSSPILTLSYNTIQSADFLSFFLYSLMSLPTANHRKQDRHRLPEYPQLPAQPSRPAHPHTHPVIHKQLPGPEVQAQNSHLDWEHRGFQRHFPEGSSKLGRKLAAEIL